MVSPLMADGHIGALSGAPSLSIEAAPPALSPLGAPLRTKSGSEPVARAEGQAQVDGHAGHTHESPLPEGEETLDRIGVGISLSCAIHCIATGLISLAPAAFGFEGSGIAWLEFLEWPFLLGAAVVGVVSLLPSYRHHHERRPLALFGVGMSLLAASRFVEGPAEIVITTVGVVTIATAHLLNLRACKH